MSTPKRQHYLPQMLLREFTDKDDWLFVFDKRIRGKGVLKLRAQQALAEVHRYTLYGFDESKDYSVEKVLQKVEGNAAKVTRKIVEAARTGKCPRLSRPEKHDLDTFSLLPDPTISRRLSVARDS